MGRRSDPRPGAIAASSSVAGLPPGPRAAFWRHDMRGARGCEPGRESPDRTSPARSRGPGARVDPGRIGSFRRSAMSPCCIAAATATAVMTALVVVGLTAFVLVTDGFGLVLLVGTT